jgi:hypothetical protein
MPEIYLCYCSCRKMATRCGCDCQGLPWQRCVPARTAPGPDWPATHSPAWRTARCWCARPGAGSPESCSPAGCPRSRQPAVGGAGGPDRLQRGQHVVSALAAHDTPQLIIAHAVAALRATGVADAVTGRRQPGRPFARRPGRAVDRPDGQRPELAEGDAAIRVMAGHVLNPVQLGVPVRSAGSFLWCAAS